MINHNFEKNIAKYYLYYFNNVTKHFTFVKKFKT